MHITWAFNPLARCSELRQTCRFVSVAFHYKTSCKTGLAREVVLHQGHRPGIAMSMQGGNWCNWRPIRYCMESCNVGEGDWFPSCRPTSARAQHCGRLAGFVSTAHPYKTIGRTVLVHELQQCGIKDKDSAMLCQCKEATDAQNQIHGKWQCWQRALIPSCRPLQYGLDVASVWPCW